MKLLYTIACWLLSLCLLQTAVAQSGYKVVAHFPVSGNGGWDYINLQPGTNQLYIAHGTQVNIIDKASGDSLGIIPNTIGVHGIAFVPALGKGFTSNGGSNTVTVFRLDNHAVIGQIAAGENPDAIFYETYSKKIITCNGRSKDLSIIDPVAQKVMHTIAVGGKPETAVSNGKGKVYVNIEDKNEIAVVDMNKMEVVAHWSIAPGQSPTGLVIDNNTHRLFAGCDDHLMVIDADNGSVVADLPIGAGCDGVVIDPALHYICTSNGVGNMTVVKEMNKDQFEVVENVPTMRGARTSCIDERTHTIYMPTAAFEPMQPGEKGRPKIKPGTFQVLKLVHE